MEEVAQVYARSLIEVARDHGELDEVRDHLGKFADALEASRDLAVYFFSPYFSTEEKEDGLRRVVQGAEPILMNFLLLLVEKHRMPVIFRIRRELDALGGGDHRPWPGEGSRPLKARGDRAGGRGGPGGPRTRRTGEVAARGAHAHPARTR